MMAAPSIRANTISSGVSVNLADALAKTMNDVHTVMVTMAAAMPLKLIMLSLSKFAFFKLLSLFRPALSNPFLCLLLLAPVLWVSTTQAQALPAEIEAVLTRSRIPKDAISLYVIDAHPGTTQPLLAHRATAPMNPASVMKLVTSVAALDLLGPAYTWQTQVLIDPAGRSGQIKDGVLDGNLVIKGGGDPKLVVERVWLLLQRVRSTGIHTISGDLMLDRSAFESVDKNPAAFDGEPMKPYNASPDALLVNYKSVVMTFTPSALDGYATIQYDPPLHGVAMPSTVALSSSSASASCGDYRGGLKADFSDPKRFRFLGTYPRACGEKVWPVAYADPASFAGRAVLGMWEGMAGKLGGMVRTVDARPQGTAAAPSSAKALFTLTSPTLAEVMRDMNKFSNNVLAQHVFLSLSLNAKSATSPASFEASQAQLAAWWKSRYGAGTVLGGAAGIEAPTVDNGSGLSRTERISALALARMLQDAYGAPFMPELLASLPMNGVDGTLRKSRATVGIAHLKTGSLNNVVSRAGYVHAQRAGKEGKRYVLVAIVNSNNPDVLAAARPVLDALTDWVAAQ
jgi:serine-type D-Ala-D-Ala carboxypeptidase/endopeptidase (penicillin-binding protein 4)